MPEPGLTLRHDVRAEDREVLRRLVIDTGFFNPGEVDIAVELIDESLTRGSASGYELVVAQTDRIVGYACWGDIPGTEGSVDVYWVVVDPRCQGRGIGRALLACLERAAARTGARRVFIDTSGRPQYQPTLEFYRRCGYDEVARIPDFYAVGDPKVIFRRNLEPPDPQTSE